MKPKILRTLNILPKLWILTKMVAECFVNLILEDKLWNLLEILKVKMLELVTWINVIFF